MKVAVIGSRNLTVTNLEQFLPKEITEIVSGGARDRHLRKGIRKGASYKTDRISTAIRTIWQTRTVRAEFANY